MIHDLWYKNAIIYCLNVETFIDSNGDGVGDFVGLTDKLAYLAGLGVTCIWLMPFYGSPNKDDGYDVADYYGVHPAHRDLRRRRRVHEPRESARAARDRRSRRQSHVGPSIHGSRRRGAIPTRRTGSTTSGRRSGRATGTRGWCFPACRTPRGRAIPSRSEYYFHRFYDFQPDLNTHNPAVKEEITRIMGFWLQLGVSGFRMDAVPFLIERKGANVAPCEGLRTAARDARLPAVAPPRRASCSPKRTCRRSETMHYFGDAGDRLQMMLNFWVNQRIFYSLATGDAGPLRKALIDTYERPLAAQWGIFLRAHDELDLGRLTERQRAERVRRVRARGADAALRSRHPPAPRADAGQRSPPHRAGEQPAVHAAGHADHPLRRRDRHGRQPRSAGTLLGAHADAVVAAAARRLHDRTPADPAGHRRSELRLPARERRGPAPRSELAAELDGAHHPHAQGMRRDRLGRLEAAAAAARQRARHPLRLERPLHASCCTTSRIAPSPSACGSTAVRRAR